MATPSPSVIVLAGPNGAGKTTSSSEVIQDTLGIAEFVNADVIAKGLSGFAPEGAALQAGRIMLERLHELAESQASFCFETTLASRSFAPWIKQLEQQGYLFHLFYFWLPSPEMAIARVAQRVRLGGHYVDDDTVRRRYRRGIENFFTLYRPLATTWSFYDNSQPKVSSLVARGRGTLDLVVSRPELWNLIRSPYDPPTPSDG
ncbi:MAG: zeta toxin family protein [Pirellulaceae bacterium]|nr:zeta toxin family protein [Pirellulaceae bacterium]